MGCGARLLNWESMKDRSDLPCIAARQILSSRSNGFPTQECFEPDSWQRFVWLRRSAIAYEWDKNAFVELLRVVEKQTNENGGSGRIVCEMGAAFAARDWWRTLGFSSSTLAACERVIQLHKKWCQEAEMAVLCWLWTARHFGVSKDIRLMIADLIWDDRAAWSEEPPSL